MAQRERSVFAITFNSNAAELSHETLIACLEGASTADVVICAFQEYDYAPQHMIPSSPAIFGAHGPDPKKQRRSSVIRLRGSQVDMKDPARLAAIGVVLGDNFELAADVAMGEPAGSFDPHPPPPPEAPPLDQNCVDTPARRRALTLPPPSPSPPPPPPPPPPSGEEKQKKKKEKKLEWYGFVRLLVWARSDTPQGALILRGSGDDNDGVNDDVDDVGGGVKSTQSLDVRAVVIPCGDKAPGGGAVEKTKKSEAVAVETPETAVEAEVAAAGEAATAVAVVPEEEAAPYEKGHSPDKGAVAVYFPRAKLCVVCAHLHGTNKYGVPEEEFDAIRRRQLRRIGGGVQWLVEPDKKKSGGSNGGGSGGSSSGSKVEGGGGGDDVALVLCGDLNFRVESSFTSPEDKAKGGKDWATVEEVAARGGLPALATLLRDHDRLRKLLQASPSSSSPPSSSQPLVEGSDSFAAAAGDSDDALAVPFLAGCVDALGEAILEASSSFSYSPLSSFPVSLSTPAGATATAAEAAAEAASEAAPILGSGAAAAEWLAADTLRPTFTFTPDAPAVPPFFRKYTDKRTPSWPDRVLVRNLEKLLIFPSSDHVAGATSTGSGSVSADGSDGKGKKEGGGGSAVSMTCRALHRVVCSDHAPVVATFTFS